MFLDYDKSEPAVGIKVDRKAEVFPYQNFWLVLNSCGIKKLAKGSKRAARVMQPAPADENYVFFEQNAHDSGKPQLSLLSDYVWHSIESLSIT